MMDDMKNKAKQKVLQEIMDLMDGNIVSDLKGHSPKMMAIEVESKKPEDSMLDEVKSKLMGDDKEESSESPEERLREMMSDDSSDKDDDNNKDEDEDLERLREMYSKLK